MQLIFNFIFNARYANKGKKNTQCANYETHAGRYDKLHLFNASFT